MLMCNPVESLEVAPDPIFEPFALAGEQLNDCASDSLVRVKDSEQQVHILPDAVAMSTHRSWYFTLGGEVCSIDLVASFGTLYFRPASERAFPDDPAVARSALCRCRFHMSQAVASLREPKAPDEHRQ